MGGEELSTCQGAKPAFLSYVFIFRRSCCKIKIVVSSGVSLGGVLIFKSILVSLMSSKVLFIGSVESDMLSSSV